MTDCEFNFTYTCMFIISFDLLIPISTCIDHMCQVVNQNAKANGPLYFLAVLVLDDDLLIGERDLLTAFRVWRVR